MSRITILYSSFIFMVTFIVTVSLSKNIDFVEIRTNGSVVIGKKLYSVLENNPYGGFWKIPYAEPPLTELRFKPPKARLDFLNDSTLNYSLPYSYDDACSTFATEDCLYLSLFVPILATESLPIMVWLHEQSRFHGPDYLIDEQVIVATVSYRTGIFGFLNTDDDFAQGNMGAKDVLMALKWIRTNIAYFNGDLNRVTVFGSGTSATIVASLLLSPAADDLFARVIIQSGSALSPADYRGYNFEVANKLYWNLGGPFERFDRKHLHMILSTATTQELASASRNLFDSSEARDSQRLINSFCPSIETSQKHAFMNKPPIEIYGRKLSSNNPEVMMGYSTLEAIYKVAGLAENRKLLPYLNYNFQYLLPFEGMPDEFGSERYKEIRKMIMDFYFLNGTITERSLRRYAKYISDLLTYPLIRQARLHSEASCRDVFLYRYRFNGCLNVGWRSAVGNSTQLSATTSGDEICYLFKCKSSEEAVGGAEATTPERHFIKKITRLWTNFAKFGNPTPRRRDPILLDVQWEPLKRDKFNVLNLGKGVRMVTAPEANRVHFWDELRDKYFSVILRRDRDEL